MARASWARNPDRRATEPVSASYAANAAGYLDFGRLYIADAYFPADCNENWGDQPDWLEEEGINYDDVRYAVYQRGGAIRHPMTHNRVTSHYRNKDATSKPYVYPKKKTAIKEAAKEQSNEEKILHYIKKDTQ